MAVRHTRAWREVLIVSAAVFAASATPSLGATITELPSISGDPTPGSVLTASTGRWTPTTATASYDWLRCDGAGDACAPVRGSCARSYTVRDADVGHTLRARLTVSEPGQPHVSGVSAQTDLVIVKPYSIPTPGDTGPGCVIVTPTGPGSGTFTSAGPTGPGSTPSPETTLDFIDPFPIVRIAGRFKGARTTLTRVAVRAPRGARIRVRCRGRGCPYRRRSTMARLVRLRSLQRTYRPRATIELRITQPAKIGKYTQIRTRRAAAPRRIDRCLLPGRARPVRCPTQ